MQFVGVLFITTVISSHFCLQCSISCLTALYTILFFIPEHGCGSWKTRKDLQTNGQTGRWRNIV